MMQSKRLLLLAAAALALLAVLVIAGSPREWSGEEAQALGLPQGWNLVAVPNGTVPGGNALTLQANDTGYESVPAGTPLVAGLGYWVFAPSRSAVPLSAGASTANITAPAGQFIMVGNPSGILPATVTGADILVGFDPSRGYFQITNNMLSPGQGAFALSVAGGRIVMQAQGTSKASCSTAELGSACPVSGACPQGYPAAVTSDTLAHPAPGPGDPAVSGTIALCFNDISQALSAGYQLAPATRITIQGPVSATTSSMRFTVLSAMLESPDAFMARVASSADRLCSGCDVSGATGIVTVEYGVENLNRPSTLISTGSFVSAHAPQDSSGSYLLLASQNSVSPVNNGSPIVGSVSGIFSHAKFGDIDAVDWRLDNPLIDASGGIPQPHGPSLLFELNFRGPNAGIVIPYGSGSAPLPTYTPGASIPPALVPPASATPVSTAPVPTITPSPAAAAATNIVLSPTPAAAISPATGTGSTYTR
jgi:hypothetical protein